MAGECVRTAWLELDDGRRLPLEDPAAGYFCAELDLGYPDVREVTSNRPDQDGADDRTTLFGGRVITANISALKGARAVIDDVAASFAPYMVARARPELHYVLERPGNPERVLTVRPAGYSWPIAGAHQREIQLQFFAADPVAYDPTERTAVAYAGSSLAPGRWYPLVFPRVYPEGSGTGPVVARLEHDGDLDARPTLRIYGPVGRPRVSFGSYHPDGFYLGGAVIEFAPTFNIDPGRFVEVDTVAYTARRDGDPLQPVEHFLVWSSLRWPSLPARPAYSFMYLEGTSADGLTQVQAAWRDGFLA
jgi:hypothetical protein